MKYIKSIFSFMLVSVLLLSSMINISANETSKLESGIYEVENDVYHEQEIGQTMARTYVNPKMKVEVKNNKFKFTLGFTGTDYMNNYRILVDDVDVKAEVVNENDEEKSIELQFETDKINPNIKAQIYVDAMGRDVEFDVITKEDTLNLIEKIEEPTPVEEKNEEEVLSENDSNSNDINTIIIVGGVVVVGLIGILILNKIRK